MRFRVTAFLATVVGLPVAAPAAMAQTAAARFELELPADKAAGHALSTAIDAVSAKVRDCIGAKSAPPELCFCRYPAEVGALRAAMDKAVAERPHWRDAELSWKGYPTPANSGFVSMKGLRLQLEVPCPP